MIPATLAERDKAAVWHPFTPLFYADDNIIIQSGKGVWFTDTNGIRYMDAISSWWVNLHGHCNPYIGNSVKKQIDELEHSIFAAFSHEPGIQLAERLLQHLPCHNKVFFSDNGSTAVEVGLKMALQYWHNLGKPRHRVVAFKDAYHGDTFGGMSVAARNAFNRPFEKLLFDVIHIDLPDNDNIEQIAQQLRQNLDFQDVACFIFEPLVLGAGGMQMYQNTHLEVLMQICKEYEVITIADEVMTGFGRTGRFFASDYLSLSPDIVCMSKGLTGGYFPLGATACKKFIYEAYISTNKMNTFFHGHSYTGNPVTCTAALASLDLMEMPKTWECIQNISDAHKTFARKITECSGIENVRSQGTIFAFDVKSKETTSYLNSSADTLAAFFLKRNIILRPLGNVLYVLPPYCITAGELQAIYDSIDELLASL